MPDRRQRGAGQAYAARERPEAGGAQRTLVAAVHGGSRRTKLLTKLRTNPRTTFRRLSHHPRSQALMFPSAVRQFAARAYARLFPGPFAAAGVALALFLGVSLVSRVGLALFNGEAAEFLPWRIAGWLAIGTVYDLAAGRVLAAALRAGRVAVARPAPAARAASRVRRLRSRRVRGAGVDTGVRVRVLERVFVPLQLHRGRLPDLHARGHRQHPRVLSDDAHRARPGGAGGRDGVAHAAAALARRRADDDDVRPAVGVDGRVMRCWRCCRSWSCRPAGRSSARACSRSSSQATASGNSSTRSTPTRSTTTASTLTIPLETGACGVARGIHSTPGLRTSPTTRRCRSSAGSTAPGRRRSSTSCWSRSSRCRPSTSAASGTRAASRRTSTGSRRRACCSLACTRRERGPCADWRRSRFRCPPRRGTRSSSGRTTRTCTRSAKCSPTRATSPSISTAATDTSTTWSTSSAPTATRSSTAAPSPTRPTSTTRTSGAWPTRTSSR